MFVIPCLTFVPCFQFGGCSVRRPDTVARNADQQRRDQRGETHQPQREEETATEGQGERREGCAEHNNRFTRNKTKV